MLAELARLMRADRSLLFSLAPRARARAPLGRTSGPPGSVSRLQCCRARRALRGTRASPGSNPANRGRAPRRKARERASRWPAPPSRGSGSRRRDRRAVRAWGFKHNGLLVGVDVSVGAGWAKPTAATYRRVAYGACHRDASPIWGGRIPAPR